MLSVSQLFNEEGKPTSTGAAQAEAVMEQIKSWKLADYIRAFVYDTTASNTGCRKGCCVRLRKELGRACFCFGCRHHVCELVAKAVWYSMFQLDLSPECALSS